MSAPGHDPVTVTPEQFDQAVDAAKKGRWPGTIKDDPQTSFWDLTIENPDLEQLLEDHAEARVAAAPYARLNKQVKKALDALEVGKRYRVGRFVVSPHAISGGGFEVPVWDSKSFQIDVLD